MREAVRAKAKQNNALTVPSLRRHSSKNLNQSFLCVLALFCVGATAAADRLPIDRNLLLQQQQSDAFALRNRQAAEALRARSRSAEEQTSLQSLHADQRRRQHALHSRQQQRLDSDPAMPDTPAQEAARRAEQAHMAQERKAQLRQFETEGKLESGSAPGGWGSRLD